MVYDNYGNLDISLGVCKAPLVVARLLHQVQLASGRGRDVQDTTWTFWYSH